MWGKIKDQLFRYIFTIVFIGIPGDYVIFGLVTPNGPAFSFSSGKKFQVGCRAAIFDNLILFVRFSGMLSFYGFDDIYLFSSRSQGSHGTPDSEKENFSGVSEIKPNSSAVRASILAYFMPNNICFIVETPGIHDLKAFGQKGVGNP